MFAISTRFVIIISSVFPTVFSFGKRETAPGPAACKNLTNILGDKVVTNHLSEPYIQSRSHYWNNRQTRYEPSCVVFPTSAQDVSISIQAIRESCSRFAIKAGGFNPNDFFSSVDEGVLIDLGMMDCKYYDSDSTLATFCPGNDFRTLYKFYDQYNVTVHGATTAEVGTGFYLGSGLSYLSSQYGMACDSIKKMEMVLPNGELVTASATENPDLFFALKCGGGNAYGIVTKYTVKTFPTGIFCAGVINYSLDQTDEIEKAISDFAMYNTNPKVVIVASFGITSETSGVALELFAVNDGPCPVDEFKNFTRIDHISNTIKPMSYPEANDLPIPASINLTQNDNLLRNRAYHIEYWRSAFAAWVAWSEEQKGQYLVTSFEVRIIPTTLCEASKATGGNAMDLPLETFVMVIYLLTTQPGMPPMEYDNVQRSFKQMVETIEPDSDLPLFQNDANKDQDPLRTFRTFEKLKQAKKKYDPDNFFACKTGGWPFD